MTNSLSRTTILIDKELWKKFKIKSIEEGKSASGMLEDMIRKKVQGK